MPRTALILGASGHAGRAIAAALATRGWQTRAYTRGTDVAAAARGADLIVNAMNPPAYHDWARQIPAITDLAMTAARASGARVLIPGNVYVYGRAPAPWSAATPHRPASRKSTIRAQMEAAWRASGLPVTILRAGDFLDPAHPGLMLDRVILKDIAKGRLSAPGPLDLPHAWAYLPDYARAAARLAEAEGLPIFADIPFPGHNFTLRDLADEIARQTGRAPRIGRFPWWQLRLAGPFWELARELTEMRYLWDHPHSLEGAALAALLPDLPQTPLAQIVAAQLAALRA